MSQNLKQKPRCLETKVKAASAAGASPAAPPASPASPAAPVPPAKKSGKWEMRRDKSERKMFQFEAQQCRVLSSMHLSSDELLTAPEKKSVFAVMSN